ncbi:hypothetical protein F0562_022975 [Nyssa sinensis]|uniref:Protein SYS1 homolog n=1 Tax=Nyssa sinensis TaxID=561372 RepID=A0A5J5BF99_9ASTE|nr:hypothetical protein F0562_022975 [Nyssa sinensis]
MFYGAVVWDPWLIVAQIVCLQCLYYLTLGLFMAILVGTRVPRMSLVYFFDYATLTASTVTGWCVMASFIFSAFAGAGYMLYLIERAKKCLDFSATLYIIHLFICVTGTTRNSHNKIPLKRLTDQEKLNRQEQAFLWAYNGSSFFALEELLDKALEMQDLIFQLERITRSLRWNLLFFQGNNRPQQFQRCLKLGNYKA